MTIDKNRHLALDVIPFSMPYSSGNELANVSEVLRSGHVHGDGIFTARATERLVEITSADHVLLTTSGTHALEMASYLLDIGEGDEVILPSFTFPSAADAVARTGAACVFVDIDPSTGNIDPQQVAEAIGSRTKAISIMHYGGVPVEVDAILSIARNHGLPVIEDNAHGLGGNTGEHRLGTVGILAAQSFHDTKNVHSGEGGALLINDPSLVERAEIMREKGTNRSQFLRGQVDKYSWVEVGSSYLMSELNAAVLDSQLESFDDIQRARFGIWDRYSQELEAWAAENGVRRMSPPLGIHSAHVFYLVMADWDSQTSLISQLRAAGIIATFHYVPLDTSPAGRRYGRVLQPLTQSEDFSRRIVRLPLWAGMPEDYVTRVIAAVVEFPGR